MCLLLQLYFGSSCISDWVTLSKVAALLQMSQKSLEPLIPDVISLALDDCLIKWRDRQHFRVCFLPRSHSFKSCYRCRLPHRAPQKSNRSPSDATWKARCRNDPQREITIRYLSSWQHTVSTVSTSAVRCQPLSKRETMWGTWSLLTQCLNDSIPQTWRQCCLLWGLVRSCSSRVQFK